MIRMGKTKTIILEAVLLFAAALFVMPVVLIVLTSLKPDAEILRFQGILPQTWTLENYAEVFAKASEVPVGLWLFNSFFVSTCITILTLTVASLCAFALARLNLPRGKGAVALIVATNWASATSSFSTKAFPSNFHTREPVRSGTSSKRS